MFTVMPLWRWWCLLQSCCWDQRRILECSLLFYHQREPCSKFLPLSLDHLLPIVSELMRFGSNELFINGVGWATNTAAEDLDFFDYLRSCRDVSCCLSYPSPTASLHHSIRRYLLKWVLELQLAICSFLSSHLNIEKLHRNFQGDIWMELTNTLNLKHLNSKCTSFYDVFGNFVKDQMLLFVLLCPQHLFYCNKSDEGLVPADRKLFLSTKEERISNLRCMRTAGKG